jgi:hypothetical protein
MSLTPIGITFSLIAILFIAVGAALVRWEAGGWGLGVRGSSPPSTSLAWGPVLRVVWLPAAAEAFVLTLLAALWFGSLGAGGWVWVFLLLGALAGGGDRWLRQRLAGGPARGALGPFAAALLKYLLAGGLCAWCLT